MRSHDAGFGTESTSDVRCTPVPATVELKGIVEDPIVDGTCRGGSGIGVELKLFVDEGRPRTDFRSNRVQIDAILDIESSLTSMWESKNTFDLLSFFFPLRIIDRFLLITTFSS